MAEEDVRTLNGIKTDIAWIKDTLREMRAEIRELRADVQDQIHTLQQRVYFIAGGISILISIILHMIGG